MYFGCCIYVLLLLNMPEMTVDWINKSILFYSIYTHTRTHTHTHTHTHTKQLETLYEQIQYDVFTFHKFYFLYMFYILSMNFLLFYSR